MEVPVLINLILGIGEPIILTCCLFFFLRNIKRDIFKKRRVYVMAFLVYAVGFTMIMFLNQNNNVYMILFELLAGSCIGYYLFHRSRLQIFYVMSYIISIFLMQTVVVWLLFAQLQNCYNVLDYTAINMTIIVKAVLAIIITCLWIFFINRRPIVQLSKWGYISLFIPLAISNFLVFSMLRTSQVYIQLYGAHLIVLTLFLIFVLNGYFIYLLSYVSKSSRLKHELMLLKAQNEMQFHYYDSLEKKYESSRKMRHDLKNHLQVLEELYKNGDMEKAKEYDSDLRHTLHSMEQIQYSGCRLLDIILNEKMKEAKDSGISMEVQIRDVNLAQMKDTDITTIFANLLDNAIEAAGQHAPNSYLHIHADRFHDFIVIHVENSIAPRDNRAQGSVEHEGLGLMNVKNTVDAYGGSYQIKESKETFRISINLPL